MTAPNVEMIAASLRSCSLGMRRGRRGEAASPVTPPHLEEATDESEGVTVELNSETALPSQWEQCLDMRTGKVYYTNWETGVRTTKDPRSAAAFAYQSSYYASDEDDEEEDVDDTSDDDSCPGVGEDEFDDTADSTSISSTLSSVSPPEASVSTAESRTGSCHVPGHGHGHGRGHGQILVAAGCKSCFMYFMVPKRVDACPKCGGGLLHLG